MQGSMKLENTLFDAFVVPEMGDSFAMKTVHVLRDYVADVTSVLERCEGVMGGIRLCVSDRRIAEVGAKPAGKRHYTRRALGCDWIRTSNAVWTCGAGMSNERKNDTNDTRLNARPEALSAINS